MKYYDLKLIPIVLIDIQMSKSRYQWQLDARDKLHFIFKLPHDKPELNFYT